MANLNKKQIFSESVFNNFNNYNNYNNYKDSKKFDLINYAYNKIYDNLNNEVSEFFKLKANVQYELVTIAYRISMHSKRSIMSEMSEMSEMSITGVVSNEDWKKYDPEYGYIAPVYIDVVCKQTGEIKQIESI